GAVVARHDLSPSADAISRLAAAGAETRWLMTTGIITFGVGVGTFAFAIRRVLDGLVWVAIGATALATAAIAAAPLDVSERLDRVHGVLAAIGYVTLVAAPLLAGHPLRDRGFDRLAVSGRAAASVAAVALGLSVTALPTGLLQRLGLTLVDLWLIALATLVTSGRLAARRPGLDRCVIGPAMG
ncbi:MAG: DUF998 domain-containing protein, partial [Ilumatobacteraceae bacterium]